jgi:NADPH:quinone reductase-like Zn-dependent oxidoreductase
MPTNTAAWLGAKGARIAVRPAPYTHPRENEIVVKNHAVAINPLDWIIQVAGNVAYRWLRYPCVLGADLAGEVVEVGSAVTRFTVGDRVLGHAVGTDKDRNTPAEGAFQEHTVVLAQMAAPIPDTMPYESAAVLPLGLSTAACGLFQQDQLALRYPSAAPQPTGQTLLVWGGSTSVGSNAIQLAVAAGYEVVTTASPRNFDYVRALGASQVFDYRSKTVVQDIIAAFRGKTLAGALAVGAGSAEPCVDIVHACTGKKFIAMASPSISFASGLTFPLVLKLVSSSVSLQVRCRTRHIRTKFIIGTTLKANEVSKVIYEAFLPQALAEGRYVVAPEPSVIGTGLEYIQTGFDVQRAGVSAKKVVVSLCAHSARYAAASGRVAASGNREAARAATDEEQRTR